jgi:hypothetical protein
MSEALVKGLAVINTRAWYDERLGANWFVHTAREREPAWPDRVLPGDWYSARTILHVHQRALEQLGGYESIRQLMEEIAGEVALKDLNGILRAFLWVASPKMFLRTAPRIWDTYCNFGTPEVLSNENERFLARITDIPADLVEWVKAAWTGFLVPALKLAGGKDPKVAIHDVKQTAGADTWEFVYELTYG